ncbi:hypothetical protein YC2023_008630 [Brassica napus]
MRRVSTSPKKSTYRKTDFCHVKGLANAIWASNFTGPTSFKFEKPVKPISRLIVISSRLYIAMTFSGVPDTVKTNGEAAVPSSPVKPVAQTGVSSGDVN